jgi:hypothetical protein
MSISNSPQLTPRLLDAARSNGRRSHGPRTAAGKQNSRMNGVKHGERSAPENHFEVMRALGEDPAQFEALKQELRDSFGPSDAFFDKQIDDLARLYWRRDRLERSQPGLMRRARQGVEAGQYGLRRALAAVTFDSSQSAMMDLDLPLPHNRRVRLRQQLSLLGVILEQVKRKVFMPRQAPVLQTYDKGQVGWRAARIGRLLDPYMARLQHEEMLRDETYKRYMLNPEMPPEPGPEHYQELLRLLEEERAAVEEAFQHEVELEEEKAAIERDACLAPSGEEWKLMLRREETLDRSIDRKIKPLLSLRKGAPAKDAGAPPWVPKPAKRADKRSSPAVSILRATQKSTADPGMSQKTKGSCRKRLELAGKKQTRRRSGQATSCPRQRGKTGNSDGRLEAVSKRLETH